MEKKLKIYVSNTFDPWFNLATEDYIFNDMDPNQCVLFLWRNSETVVIGRFQNPWRECDVKRMEQDEIKLARRQSGGGAVFHDLGNTNFTFMSGTALFSKSDNNAIICNALKRFGVTAEPSGRNDIVVAGKKISGSAFKEKKDRAFHHGTLLIDVNLGKLKNYLTPDMRKLAAKGVESVRARVTNLVELNSEIKHETLSQAIIEEFCSFYGEQVEVEVLDHQSLLKIPSLQTYYEQLKDWDWRFGRTPEFSHLIERRFDWGGISLHLDVVAGRIRDFKIFSDALDIDFIELLQKALQGCPYRFNVIQETLSVIQHPFIKDVIQMFEEEV